MKVEPNLIYVLPLSGPLLKFHNLSMQLGRRLSSIACIRCHCLPKTQMRRHSESEEEQQRLTHLIRCACTTPPQRLVLLVVARRRPRPRRAGRHGVGKVLLPEPLPDQLGDGPLRSALELLQARRNVSLEVPIRFARGLWKILNSDLRKVKLLLSLILVPSW